MWKILSGALLAVLIGISTFVLMQQLSPSGGGGSSSTTTAPSTTAAPTSTAAGTTTTTTMPMPTEVGLAVVKANDLVEAKRQALAAIPVDQTVALYSAKAEYTQARALMVDAQNAALPQPSMMLSWLQLAISIAMMIFMIIVVVVILRSQSPKVTKPQPAPAQRRQPTPKPPTAPVPPTPPATAKHRRSASTPAPWPDERDFEIWFYDQPVEVQALLKKERMSWPPGQETERWEALRAAMAAQAASTA